MRTKISVINQIQIDFIKEIQKDINHSQSAASIPFIKYPKDYTFRERPVVTKFFLKPVVIMVPHKQFPGISMNCLQCNDTYKPVGWPTNPVARYMHGLNYGSYILQYRYSCQCGSVDSTVIQNLLSICRHLYPVETFTKKSAVDKDLMVYITSDATTGNISLILKTI